MPDELLDMAAVARSVARARIPIAFGLIVGAILGVAVAVYLAPYRSGGIYTIGVIRSASNRPVAATPQDPNAFEPARVEPARGMSVQAFKIAYSELDRMRFRRFLEHRRDAQSNASADVERILASPDERSRALLPIYATTRAELRELGESSNPQENSAIAVQVALSARSPDEATREAAIVGDFIGETVFAAQAEGLISSRVQQYETARVEWENKVLEQNFLVGTTGQKIARLQELRREVPDSRIADVRQIVSVGDGGAYYLPPATQLVGAKSGLADLREKIARDERTRDVAELLAAYYRRAQRASSEGGDSQTLLAKFSALAEGSFAHGGTESELSEARNMVSLDLNTLRALRARYLRFASGPTEGWRDPTHAWKYPLAGAAAGALLVALVAVGRRAVS